MQPEVAARAVLWAGDRAPRELNVGASTLRTRLANLVAPGLLDRYLARTGFAAQQTDTPVDPGSWQDNLDTPVDADRDFGAHGDFDDRAHDRSPALWAATHPRTLGAAALLGGAAAVATALGLRHRTR